MRPPRLDQLDDIDRNLVALLQMNARESVANLARQLGVARTTVIARIARLEKNSVIAGYGVRLGQDVLDASIQAYVGIKLAPKYVAGSASSEVRNELRQLIDRAHQHGIQVIAPRVEDAQAAAYVECEVDGRAWWGVGVDANTVTASLRAVLSAVNRSRRG